MYGELSISIHSACNYWGKSFTRRGDIKMNRTRLLYFQLKEYTWMKICRAMGEVCTKGWRPKKKPQILLWQPSKRGEVQKKVCWCFLVINSRRFPYSVLKRKVIMLRFMKCSNCKCYTGLLASFIYVWYRLSVKIQEFKFLKINVFS